MHKSTRLVAALAPAVLSLGLLGPVSATAAPASTAASTQRDLVDNPAKASFRAAVEPSECDVTLLDAYVDEQINAIPDEDWNFVVEHQDTLFDVPTYDALFFGTAGDPAFALDSHARQLQNTFRDLKRFWSDVRSDDIHLMAMHGETLLDEQRIARTLTAMVELGLADPMTPAEIQEEASTVASYLREDGALHDNPLWTLNAFAFSGEGDPDPAVAALPDKLVFGDGILEAYDSFGLGDVGPRVIMGHEFAHHIQFELGVFETGPSDPAEATRRTELMADAMAAYHGVHKKGLTLNRKRVVDALLSFYSVGDCSWSSPGHHGTPAQRERAAAWGAELAAAAQPKSRVLPAETVVEEFEEALPGIISGS